MADPEIEPVSLINFLFENLGHISLSIIFSKVFPLSLTISTTNLLHFLCLLSQGLEALGLLPTWIFRSCSSD